MRIPVSLAVAVFVGTCFVVVPLRGALPQGTAAPETMPAGKGKDLVTSLCVGCHPLDTVLSKRASRGQWSDTVQTMIRQGAQITSEEATTIADYLAEHYGPSAPAASAPAESPSEASPGEPPASQEAQGKELLTQRCFQCHGQGMWKDLRLDRRGWEGVLYRMVGRGALWPEDDINAMADYLAEAYGPGAGKQP